MSGGGKSRLLRIISVNYKLLFANGNLINNLIIKRNIAIEANSSEKINPNDVVSTNVYETSTIQQEVHVSHDQKGQSLSETIPRNATITKDGTVWSSQSLNSKHTASLANDTPLKVASTSTKHGSKIYTTQGELNITNPFKTHILQTEKTSAKLAEAAASSAFQSFPVNTPLTTEANFAPKIASTETYSKSSSLSTDFDTSVSLSGESKKIKYETAKQSKVFSRQLESVETIIRPKENSFDSKDKQGTSDDSKEIPIRTESDIKNDILRESLKYVHEKGWTMDAIRDSIKKCNQPETTESLFYNSYDLVDYFMRDANAKMSDYMDEMAKKEDIEGNRLLIEGLKYRLKLVIPYVDTWEQALAQKGLPPNAKRAWKTLLDLANSAWLSIDDTSTDMKWYTKRISIATIYRSAEIYMLRDQSPDKIESMNFLERHLGDFETTGTVRRSVSQSMSDTVQVASGLLTVVRTMTNRHK